MTVRVQFEKSIPLQKNPLSHLSHVGMGVGFLCGVKVDMGFTWFYN